MPVSADRTPRPASTVMILRDGPVDAAPEVFLVRRHQGVAFLAGAHVFPGGRVDAGDRDAVSDRWCDGLDEAGARFPGMSAADAVAYHMAAIRELFEEAGVLLARDATGELASTASAGGHETLVRYRAEIHAGIRTLREMAEHEHLRLALDALVPWAHWATPPIDVRLFDARFFAARAPAAQTPAHDDGETTDGLWITAADALTRPDIVLAPPTWTSLRELEPFMSVDAALAWARQRLIVRREPKVVDGDGGKILLLPGDPLHPAAPAGEPPRETRFALVDGRWRPERACR